jgi:hypothetical protein
MYNLPELNFDIKKIKNKALKVFTNRIFLGIFCLIIALGIIIFGAGTIALQ